MCQIEKPAGSNYFQNSATASCLSGALVIKVLKSKKLKVDGGRLSNGFLAFYSVTSSSPSSSFFFASFFGASTFFGASYFFGASLTATLASPEVKAVNYYYAKTGAP